jgi:hypothetical protein
MADRRPRSAPKPSGSRGSRASGGSSTVSFAAAQAAFDAAPGPTFPSGAVGDATNSLPLEWVWRTMARALPPRASIDSEAVHLVAASAGEFIALLCEAARAAEGRGDGVGASAVGVPAVLGALSDIGFSKHEALLRAFVDAQLAARTRAMLGGSGAQPVRGGGAAPASPVGGSAAAAADVNVATLSPPPPPW